MFSLSLTTQCLISCHCKLKNETRFKFVTLDDSSKMNIKIDKYKSIFTLLNTTNDYIVIQACILYKIEMYVNVKTVIYIYIT